MTGPYLLNVVITYAELMQDWAQTSRLLLHSGHLKNQQGSSGECFDILLHILSTV